MPSSANSHGSLDLSVLLPSLESQSSDTLNELLALEQYLQQLGLLQQKDSTSLLLTATVNQAESGKNEILDQAKSQLQQALTTFLGTATSTAALGVFAPAVATSSIKTELSNENTKLSNLNKWEQQISNRKSNIGMGNNSPSAQQNLQEIGLAKRYYDYTEYSPENSPATPEAREEQTAVKKAIQTAKEDDLRTMQKRIERQKKACNRRIDTLNNQISQRQQMCSMLNQAMTQIFPSLGTWLGTHYMYAAADAKLTETLASGTAQLIQQALQALGNVTDTAKRQMSSDIQSLLTALAQINSARA